MQFDANGDILVVHQAYVKDGKIVYLLPDSCFYPFDESKEYLGNTGPIVYSKEDRQPKGILKYVLKGSKTFRNLMLIEKLNSDQVN